MPHGATLRDSLRRLATCLTAATGALWLAAIPSLAAPTEAAPTFEQLLQEGGLAFRPPAGFVLVEPEANAVFPYERAVREASGALEIRYAIRPLGRLKIDYSDPHSSAPEPDHVFNMMFAAITNRLAAGRHSPQREYSSAQARELFNADWAAASVFAVNPKFSSEYGEALLLALHKQGKADAYAIFLYREPENAKAMIRDALRALSFLP